ncbi:hypothetical protein BROOK1789C_1085 [Bathymodiolus brooksi thiotrophic gill symbiont]|nr:hypothetical protein BROOK1789C_1085 [Bathymodiolus brooksi thiotrophic gill symbiont]
MYIPSQLRWRWDKNYPPPKKKPLQTISCKRQPLTTITAASIMAIDDVSGFFSSSNLQ